MSKKTTGATKPLNARQERFADFVAGGMPASKAYTKAGYSQNPRTAEAHASRMVENGRVKERIAEIRARDAAKEEFTRQNLIDHLVAAICTPISEVDANSPLAQEVTEEIITCEGRGRAKGRKTSPASERTVIRRRVKMMGKLECARLLCEIKGWKEPEQLVIEAGPKTLEALEARARDVTSALDRNGLRS